MTQEDDNVYHEISQRGLRIQRLEDINAELLAALEAVELWSREHPNGTCEAINEKARAAIAKAKP